MLEFNTRFEADKAVVEVKADLDTQDSGSALIEACDDLLKDGYKTIVLDLATVENVNSYGIGRLAEAYTKLTEKQATLMVRNVPDFLKELFRLLRLKEVFPEDKKQD